MKTFIRTIYWYLYFNISILFTIPYLIFIHFKKKSYSKSQLEDKVNELSRKWVKKQITNANVNVTIEGYENIPEENVLFVSNHQGNFDIALYMYYIKKNKGFVCKKEMLRPFSILCTWMKYLRCIFIDRNDVRQSASAILEGIKILKDGYSLVVFPEGTRSKTTNKMNKFRAGSLKLATKSKVPIVPITIDGTYKLMELNNYKIKPGNVYIKIHKPIYTNNLTSDELKNLSTNVENIIKSGLNKKELV